MHRTLSICLRTAALAISQLCVLAGAGASLYVQGQVTDPPYIHTYHEETIRDPRFGPGNSGGGIGSPASSTPLTRALEQAESALKASPPRYADAERAYLKATYFDARDARAYVGLGRMYVAQNLFTNAVNSYKKAIEIRPKLALVHYNLALVYFRLNNKEEALKEQKILERLKSPLAKSLEAAINN